MGVQSGGLLCHKLDSNILLLSPMKAGLTHFFYPVIQGAGDGDPVSAIFLRLVQGLVGSTDQLLELTVLACVFGNPYADRDLMDNATMVKQV